MSMTLEGDEALKKLFRDTLPREARKAVKQGARKGAKVVAESAKIKAPRESGELRRSIKVRALKRTRTGKLGAVVLTGDGFFKGDQFYAGFIEYGTVNMPAQPFLRPAADENRVIVHRIFIESIRQSHQTILRGVKIRG